MRPAPPPVAAASARDPALAAIGGGLIGGAGCILALARRSKTSRALERHSEREAQASAAGEWRQQGAVPMSDALSPTGGGSFAAEPILRVQHLTKTFGRQRAVDDLDFTVAPGEAVALWGRNGAGKTTVIKCVLGLYRYRGTITVAGRDVRRQSKAARRRVGYVSQELAFYAELTARDTLHLFARLRQVPLARAAALLERVELGPHAAKPVKALSGGMKQRLALAVALLSDPPLLLLDEPTANLDAASRELLLHLLAELRQGGQTIVFSTHRLEEVRHLADRVLVLEQGRKVADCTPAELAGRLGPRRTLRIPLEAALRPAALDALAAAGLSAAGNGRCIRVPITGGQQAVPLRVLAAAGIPFEDFELESEGEHA
jgi:ABC-type multidrug transport system ATPase subunit